MITGSRTSKRNEANKRGCNPVSRRRGDEQFTEDGLLTVEIITGLQALSRDSDLQKLMQMGEMVRNLPEQAMTMFKWDEYGRALITSLGFDSNMWVKSKDEIKEEEEAAQQQQMQSQVQQGAIDGVQGVAQGAMQQAAQQDIEQNEGAGMQEMAQQMGLM